ncbi:cation:proton antiporter [Desulforhabdus sp. TSK]|uniref:cation:proton antiporter domain-containing protein n=1 Tax=Desulforhabdus sp. TSK TaxID=2925014 RepID=UPI001FC872D3|nr:cation:proton antiporter [Desulforhabdus sp. TSK]GKT10314.1 sodium:proton antiporter [Desulforhabdus sp. TSK]
MTILVVFILLVFGYSLASRRMEHTILTAPMVFTGVGMLLVITLPVLGELDAERKAFLLLAEIGLVLTLFSDATRINLGVLRANENLPIRLLSIGMLPTILLGALTAAFIFPELSLWEASILAAILAPTDAGLGEVIVNSPQVPTRVRQALNVEAGLNDGLSVPFMMCFIALAEVSTKGAGAVLMQFVWEQLGFGALVGAAIGFAGGGLLGLANRKGWMAESLQQFGLVALPILCVIGCEPIGGSMFIAAYVAGLVVQMGFGEAGQKSVEFTEGWGRLLDFFVFFLFGMLVARVMRQFTPALAVYAMLSLTVVRMLPVAMALIGTRLSVVTAVFMGWFGLRGLASIVLGLVYLEQESRLPGESTIRLAVMATVLLSIFAHGLSAVPGISLYARKIAMLDASAPELQEK